MTLASVLLYPKTLGGGAVFSGWVPFNSTIIDRIHPDAKRVLHSFCDHVIILWNCYMSLFSLRVCSLVICYWIRGFIFIKFLGDHFLGFKTCSLNWIPYDWSSESISFYQNTSIILTTLSIQTALEWTKWFHIHQHIPFVTSLFKS